jgi:hypothetical protein
MVEYRCEKCEKTFKKKYDYINHINRIRPCDRPSNICVYCGVKYATKGNVARHIKTNCGVYMEREREKKQIFEELSKLKEKNERITNEVNELRLDLVKQKRSNGRINKESRIGTQNNIHIGDNNITIVAFGNEKMDKINMQNIISSVSHGYQTSVYLTNAIHFDPNNPEYHNVYIPSMNTSCAMIYDGIKWKLAPRTEVIDSIYQDNKYYVEENLEEFKKSLSEFKLKALKRWIDTDDEDEVVKRIKKDMELLLYNGRKIPIATQKNNKAKQVI